MLVLRPVELTDLPQLQRLARESLVGVTSLPDDTERLRERILDSCASFEQRRRRVTARRITSSCWKTWRPSAWSGCSEILATAGFSEPFYSLRNRPFHQRLAGTEHRAWRAGPVAVPRPQRPHLAARLSYRCGAGAHSRFPNCCHGRA